jgi:hypothetical protein
MLGDAHAAGTAGWIAAASASELIWPSAALVGLVLLGAIVLTGMNRWRHRTPGGPQLSEDPLATFQTLYEQGTLSREEFDRIRARLRPQAEAEQPKPPPASPPPVKPGP